MKLPEYFEEKFKDLMDADEYELFKSSLMMNVQMACA